MRTGLGGQKVVMDGGAMVLPIFHEVIPVNMNTLKLEVMRNKAESRSPRTACGWTSWRRSSFE